MGTILRAGKHECIRVAAGFGQYWQFIPNRFAEGGYAIARGTASYPVGAD
jgi:hypothetical protein